MNMSPPLIIDLPTPLLYTTILSGQPSTEEVVEHPASTHRHYNVALGSFLVCLGSCIGRSGMPRFRETNISHSESAIAPSDVLIFPGSGVVEADSALTHQMGWY